MEHFRPRPPQPPQPHRCSPCSSHPLSQQNYVLVGRHKKTPDDIRYSGMLLYACVGEYGKEIYTLTSNAASFRNAAKSSSVIPPLTPPPLSKASLSPARAVVEQGGPSGGEVKAGFVVRGLCKPGEIPERASPPS